MTMLKYREVINYTLGVLYKLKQNGEVGYFSLRKILNYFDYPSSPSEIYQLGKYLEAEGYVKAIYSLGDVFIEITTEGIIHIEDMEDKFFSSFEDLIKEKNKIENASAKLTDETIIESRKPIIEKLKTIKKKLKKINGEELTEAQSDIDIVEIELKKLNPNKEILILKLSELKNINSIKTDVRELLEMLDINN